MGSILASQIINRVATTLFDANNVIWSRSELLAWLNAGQRAIAVANPTVNSQTVTQQMAAGARQILPADGWALIDVYCNMGRIPGDTEGRAVRKADRKLLDGFNPGWRKAPAVTEVQHFLFDPQDQSAYWVYPPSDGTGFIQINYIALPADIADTDPITISDAYEQSLIDYVLSRAYTKATVGNPNLAGQHAAAFSRDVATAAASPQSSGPGTPEGTEP